MVTLFTPVFSSFWTRLVFSSLFLFVASVRRMESLFLLVFLPRSRFLQINLADVSFFFHEKVRRKPQIFYVAAVKASRQYLWSTEYSTWRAKNSIEMNYRLWSHVDYGVGVYKSADWDDGYKLQWWKEEQSEGCFLDLIPSLKLYGIGGVVYDATNFYNSISNTPIPLKDVKISLPSDNSFQEYWNLEAEIAKYQTGLWLFFSLFFYYYLSVKYEILLGKWLKFFLALGLGI